MTRIQRSPTAAPAFTTSVSRWNSPANRARAGGDWCEIVHVSADVVGLTVGDVSGHGEPAAQTMHLMRSSIVQAVRESSDPAEILSMANALAYARDGGVIVTAIVAFLDRGRGTLTFANAGHPPPLMAFADGHDFLSHVTSDLPLGIFPIHSALPRTVDLCIDALTTLYTDGFTERERNLIRGERELAAACRRVYGSREPDAARLIAHYVFRDGRGNDDAAVLAVRTVPHRAESSLTYDQLE